MKSQVETQQPSQPIQLPPPVWEQIGAWLVDHGLFLGAIAIAVAWRRLVQPRLVHSQLRLRYSVAQDLEIKSVLSQILGVCRADRVLVCEFHNGEHLASQRHWMKLSATQEIVAPGIQPIASKIRDVPQSQLAQELDLIQDGHLHTVHRDHNVSEECREYMIGIGVYAARYQLLVSRGEALGILVVHYREDPCAKARCQRECLQALAMSAEELRRFEELRIRLVGLLRQRSELLDAVRAIFVGHH